MGKNWERRHADLSGPFITPGYLSTGNTGTCYSTVGLYSSDIGNLILRASTIGNKFSLAHPTTDLGAIANIYGILHGFDADSSNLNGVQYIAPGSTQKIYVEKFSFDKEYAASFSTLNSTVLPGTSDIGSLVGFSTGPAAEAVPYLCMGNIDASTGPGKTITADGSKCFRVTGYDTGRRKLHVVPVRESSSFTAW